MSDLISRQAAMAFPLSWEHRDKEHGSDEFISGVECYRDYIEELPSAQQEIIRCKDCKYRGETEDGEYNPEDIVCAYWMSDGLSETDYCSYAKRRTDEGHNL